MRSILIGFVTIICLVCFIYQSRTYAQMPAHLNRLRNGIIGSDFGAIYGAPRLYWLKGGNPFSSSELEAFMKNEGFDKYIAPPFFYSPTYILVAWPAAHLSALQYYILIVISFILFGITLLYKISMRSIERSRVENFMLISFTMLLAFGGVIPANVIIGTINGLIFFACLMLLTYDFRGEWKFIPLCLIIIILSIKWIFILVVFPLFIIIPYRTLLRACALSSAIIVAFLVINSNLIIFYIQKVGSLPLGNYSMLGISLDNPLNVSLFGIFYRLQRVLSYTGYMHLNWFNALSLIAPIITVGYGLYCVVARQMNIRHMFLPFSLVTLLLFPIGWDSYFLVPAFIYSFQLTKRELIYRDLLLIVAFLLIFVLPLWLLNHTKFPESSVNLIDYATWILIQSIACLMIILIFILSQKHVNKSSLL